MMSFNEAPSKRKALSARKSVDCHELIGDKVDKLNELPKCAGSASNLSTRAKLMQQRKYFDSLLADLCQAYYKINCISDQKSFLNACQVLEKLSKVISVLTTAQDSNSCHIDKTSTHHTMHLSLKKVQFYHDVLKRLLEERCSIVINEECNFCITQTQKMVYDFKQLYRAEKLKMKTLPVQSFNRFIDSTDISISFLESLLKRIQIICDLHLSLKSNYLKMTNISRVGFDLELYQTLLKTIKILHNLKSNLFYWAEKNVNIFLKKLCLADSNFISPEFLQNVLKICDEFSSIMKKDRKQVTSEFSRDEHFSSTVMYEHETRSLILQYLSHFEAKVASERIVHFLISECKRDKQKLRKKPVCEDIAQNCSSTSDYCSANASDLGTEQSLPSIFDASTNFCCLLGSLIQRSQTLVLKYLYSITKLKSVSLKNERNVPVHMGEISISKPIRHSWLVPQINLDDGSYTFLEDKYWMQFWNKLQSFVIRSLSEVPYHQYGGPTAGSVFLWPDSYLCKVSEILKIALTNEDILPEGRGTIKEIYNFILIYSVQMLWDKKFSSTISAMHLYLCIPVPTVSNGARTYPGNLFCNCVELLIQLFLNTIHCSKSLSCLKSVQQLQATLDSFILWMTTKTRALVSNNNLPAYLLICCFDCKWALSILKNISFQSGADVLEEMQVFKSANKKLSSIISKQIEFFEGWLQDASNLMYCIIFTHVKKCLCYALESKFLWKKVFKDNLHLKQSEFSAVHQILIPLTEIANKCNFKPVVSSVVSAVSQAFLFILNRLKRKISTRHIQILIENFREFFKWFSGLKLKHIERKEIERIHSYKKVCCIMKLLETTNAEQQHCIFSRNRISPMQLAEMGPSEDITLSDQERMYWRTVNRAVCLCC
ncbi:uncharacterized protein LOC129218379 [Uloborus diversus]|uniref:uncharacterized protein LOC129218379 n=1 Tax=Uloborus diversus TaxID=327109 RepID=UPI002409DFC2|nr:uncharacterized protein LOC129218379 [Uloborus diversus]